MTKILIFSDLHGDKDALALLIDKIKMEKPTTLINVGDFGLFMLGRDFDKLKNLSIPLLNVQGNCDSRWEFNKKKLQAPPIYITKELNDRKIVATHGDLYYDWKLFPLYLDAKDIFVSGHTHVAHLYQNSSGPILLNPGSVSSPRDNNEPSYATIDENEIVIKTLFNSIVLKSLKI